MQRYCNHNGSAFKIDRRNKRQLHIVCPKDCSFLIRARCKVIGGVEGNVHITFSNLNHISTCRGGGQRKRNVKSSVITKTTSVIRTFEPTMVTMHIC